MKICLLIAHMNLGIEGVFVSSLGGGGRGGGAKLDTDVFLGIVDSKMLSHGLDQSREEASARIVWGSGGCKFEANCC